MSDLELIKSDGTQAKEKITSTELPNITPEQYEAYRTQRQQAEQPQTIEQISNDLNAWLSERGVSLQVVAIGRTGTPSPIDDFMPVTHQASITLVKAKQ